MAAHQNAMRSSAQMRTTTLTQLIPPLAADAACGHEWQSKRDAKLRKHRATNSEAPPHM